MPPHPEDLPILQALAAHAGSPLQAWLDQLPANVWSRGYRPNTQVHVVFEGGRLHTLRAHAIGPEMDLRALTGLRNLELGTQEPVRLSLPDGLTRVNLSGPLDIQVWPAALREAHLSAIPRADLRGCPQLEWLSLHRSEVGLPPELECDTSAQLLPDQLTRLSGQCSVETVLSQKRLERLHLFRTSGSLDLSEHTALWSLKLDYTTVSRLVLPASLSSLSLGNTTVDTMEIQRAGALDAIHFGDKVRIKALQRREAQAFSQLRKVSTTVVPAPPEDEDALLASPMTSGTWNRLLGWLDAAEGAAAARRVKTCWQPRTTHSATCASRATSPACRPGGWPES